MSKNKNIGVLISKNGATRSIIRFVNEAYEVQNEVFGAKCVCSDASS